MQVKLFENEVKQAVIEYLKKRGVVTEAKNMAFECLNGSSVFTGMVVSIIVSSVDLPISEGPYR